MKKILVAGTAAWLLTGCGHETSSYFGVQFDDHIVVPEVNLTTELDEYGWYQTTADAHYEFGAFEATIWEGFGTDGMSVNPTGNVGPEVGPSVWHDAAYICQWFDRKQTDYIYYLMLKDVGYGEEKSRIVWKFLEYFGQAWWDSITPEEVQECRKIFHFGYRDLPDTEEDESLIEYVYPVE